MSVRENVKSNSIIRLVDKTIATQLFWIVAFAILTAFAAQVSVPVEPVPFTLQTMFVVLAGAFLGSKNGAYSQILYLGLGVIGLPVFAEFSFGLAKLFGPTGGYLLAFPVGAFISGYLVEKSKKYITVFLSMLLSSFIVILIGSAYLSLFFDKAFISGALIFTLWDILKIAAASSIYFGISKKYPRLPL